MDNCNHQWIAYSGSNDKPCVYCQRYSVLKLRYRCCLCILESCKFCLTEKHQLPPESSTSLDIRPNRHQSIELRIITLKIIIDNLQKQIRKLEDINK